MKLILGTLFTFLSVVSCFADNLDYLKNRSEKELVVLAQLQNDFRRTAAFILPFHSMPEHRFYFTEETGGVPAKFIPFDGGDVKNVIKSWHDLNVEVYGSVVLIRALDFESKMGNGYVAVKDAKDRWHHIGNTDWLMSLDVPRQ